MEKRYTALEWAAMEGGHEVTPAKVTAKLPFINELTEARLFRNTSQIQGHSAKELAVLMYSTILCLEALRHVDSRNASAYAWDTIFFGDFSKTRPAASDLFNMMAILNNQDNYEGVIKTDYDISPAVLEVKGYLRRVVNGTAPVVQDRFVLINLGEMLGIYQSDLQSARRTIAFWDSHTNLERRLALDAAVRNVKRYSSNLDILQLLNRINLA